ncbi:MAG: GNAT family N-acetyltransferase [Gammaproteobacteria bacterium]
MTAIALWLSKPLGGLMATRSAARAVSAAQSAHSVAAHIRLARPDEVGKLQRIEAKAAERFRGLGLIDHVLGEVTAAADLLSAIAQRQAWVVVLQNDVPVGYAAASLQDEFGYLQEMDVLPDYGRLGFGAQLVERVCQWVRAAGFESLMLTTFRDVPWNGPFYQKLGFEHVPDRIGRLR